MCGGKRIPLVFTVLVILALEALLLCGALYLDR